MTEDFIQAPVGLDQKTMDKINRMTKKEIIEKLRHAAVEAQVATLRCYTALEDVNRLNKENADLKTRLDKAQAYVAQGRAMIEATMDRWYHYDT